MVEPSTASAPDRPRAPRWLVTGVLGAGAGLACTLLWLKLGTAATAPASVVRTPAPKLHAAPAHAAPAPPKPKPNRVLRQRAFDTPDLTQTDPELGVPGGGNSYCGPVAISNSVMWLSSHGYPKLAPPGPTPHEQQLELVRRLGSHHYMATSPYSGTGAFGILPGLARWAKDAGYQVKRLEYEGWRGHALAYDVGVRKPDLHWIASALHPGGAAWINVGWYKPGPGGHAYHRHGGHWLTVVDAGHDERGAPDPSVLVLHDPAPYAGTKFENTYVRVEPIDHGWMLDGKNAFPAKGYAKVGGGMHIKREGDVAIIDGAIVLELAPPGA
jgi:hypothetical protein